jgi:hypothetical protein
MSTPYFVNSEFTGKMPSQVKLSPVKTLAKVVDETTNLSLKLGQLFKNKLSILHTKLKNIGNNSPEEPEIDDIIVQDPIDVSLFTLNDKSIEVICENVKDLYESLTEMQDYILNENLEELGREIDLVAEKCKTPSITTGGSKYSKKRRVNRSKRLSKRKSSTMKRH